MLAVNFEQHKIEYVLKTLCFENGETTRIKVTWMILLCILKVIDKPLNSNPGVIGQIWMLILQIFT